MEGALDRPDRRALTAPSKLQAFSKRTGCRINIDPAFEPRPRAGIPWNSGGYPVIDQPFTSESPQKRRHLIF
jgi:hypothetical protein